MAHTLCTDDGEAYKLPPVELATTGRLNLDPQIIGGRIKNRHLTVTNGPRVFEYSKCHTLRTLAKPPLTRGPVFTIPMTLKMFYKLPLEPVESVR